MITERALLASGEWTMAMGFRQRADGQVFYYADIFRVGAFVRRISMSEPVENKIAAEVALADQARKWISDYETKAHTGVTDFGELGGL